MDWMLWVGGHVGEVLQSCVAFGQSYVFFLISRKSAVNLLLYAVKVAPKITFNGNTDVDFYYLVTFTFDLDLSKCNGVEL